MPVRARRLKDAALLCIAKNIEYWTEMIPEDAENYLYLLSPFSILDYGLTQLVFDALIRFNKFQPKHIHLLFHDKLDSIDLSKCAAYRLGDVTLKTLFKRCKKIKKLVLSGRTRFSRNLINSIPKRYSNLQSLVITHESIRDDLILNLASFCKNLTCFQSGTCCKISDNTFKKLAELENLRSLLLGNADLLSGETLLMILKSCRKLHQLSLPMTSLDFKFLPDDCIFESLMSLDLTLSPVDDKSMEKITISFPRLTDLCLSNCENVTSRTLIQIQNNSKNIESVNLSYTGIKRYTDIFENFLKIIGVNLHYIDVSGIAGIKTSIFGMYCKHLEKLCMNHCQEIVTNWIIEPGRDRETNTASNGAVDGREGSYSLLESCPHLVSLQIDARNKAAENQVFDLEAILRNGHLKSLHLNSIPNFTDSEISTLIECMNIKDLKNLNLSGNHNVTVHGIWLAIENIDNLETIKVTECDIVEQELWDLKRKAINRGFEVQIIR